MQHETPEKHTGIVADPSGLPPSFDGVMWWAMLLIGVLAVPSLAIIISLVVPASNNLMQIVVFVVACWVSTWIGMWLMKKSRMQIAPKAELPPSHNE